MANVSLFRVMARMLAAACLIATIGASRSGAQQKIESELVTLRDGGFYPSKIVRPSGTFFLVVLNRSHANKISLGITGPGASVIAAVEDIVDLKQSYLLELTANTYVLKDSAHPGWTPLTITLH